MESSTDNLFALAVIFVMFILPLWLILHFRYKSKITAGALADEERARLIELEYKAAHLTRRLDTLEKILNDLDPNWKNDGGY